MLRYMGDFLINTGRDFSASNSCSAQHCILRTIIPARLSTFMLIIFALLVTINVSTSQAATTWVLRDGNMTIHLDQHALSSHGLSVRTMMKGSDSNDRFSTELAIANADEVAFLSDGGVVHEWYSHDLSVAGGLRILSRHGSSTVYDFRIISDDSDSARVQFNFSSDSESDNLKSPPWISHFLPEGIAIRF